MTPASAPLHLGIAPFDQHHVALDSTLEIHMEYVAKKEDLKNLENTLIKWMLGILGTALVALFVIALRFLNGLWG